MRYQRIFEWGTNEASGEDGWIPSWLEGCDDPYAFIGDGVAHDVLEHEAAESDGDLENETRALGAVYFIRGESGWFGSRVGNSDPAENIASDFVELYRAFAYAGDSIGGVDPATTAQHEMAPLFRDIVRQGIRNAIAEHSCDREERATLAQFAQGRAWYVQLMCEGYAAASARFEGKGYAARDLFERIAAASEDAASYAQDMGSGQFIVNVDTVAGKYSATCELYENPTYGDEL